MRIQKWHGLFTKRQKSIFWSFQVIFGHFLVITMFQGLVFEENGRKRRKKISKVKKNQQNHLLVPGIGKDWPGRHRSWVSISAFFFFFLHKRVLRLCTRRSWGKGKSPRGDLEKKKVLILTQNFLSVVDWSNRCRKTPLYDFFFFSTPRWHPFGLPCLTTDGTNLKSTIYSDWGHSQQQEFLSWIKPQYHFFHRFEHARMPIFLYDDRRTFVWAPPPSPII